MLEHISYINDCDTLGQKANKKDIHEVIHCEHSEAFLTVSQALVSVYQKILEFYKVAFGMLEKKGAKLVMTVILQDDRLPNIVQGFLRQADTLRKLVQKATWEIVEDIKVMLYDRESKS